MQNNNDNNNKVLDHKLNTLFHNQSAGQIVNRTTKLEIRQTRQFRTLTLSNGDETGKSRSGKIKTHVNIVNSLAWLHIDEGVLMYCVSQKLYIVIYTFIYST